MAGTVEAWRQRILGDQFQKWVILGVLIGIVAGLGAIAFFEALNLATRLLLGIGADVYPPLPKSEGVPTVVASSRPWVIPIITTLGGLLSGILVYTLAPEAEGHGTDAAIQAFHEHDGRIRKRIPALKLVASAITIGSGGSAGREGPTAQIAAGFGSWVGDLLDLDAEDRRIAVAVGIGAGIGAIFKAPLGGAVLAGEILYVRDFEPQAIIPGFIASVIGYTIFAAESGWTPVFGHELALQFDQPVSLIWYAVLGLAAGGCGVAYTRVFYGLRDLTHKIPIPPHVKPAIGGLLVGLIALAYPQVLSAGYGWIQLAIDGNTVALAVGTMFVLIALKIIATSLTIGTGGSGGVFAPGLFIGAMLGGGLWSILHGHVPWMPSVPAPFVIVGMMALFGGIAKAPIAVLLMVAEMTGEVSMVVPAMIATVISYRLTRGQGIYESQVFNRAHSPAHAGEYTIPLMLSLTVGQAMHADVSTLSPRTTLAEANEVMERSRVRGLPVTDNGQLVGMLSTRDAELAASRHVASVADAMSRKLVRAHPAESLQTALQRMARAGMSNLPVVESEHPDRLVGMLTIRDMASVLDAETSLSGTQLLDTDGQDPLTGILVRSAMTTNFVSLPGTATLAQAGEQLSSAGKHAAVVLGERGELAGILTADDVESAAEGELSQPVASKATQSVTTVFPSQPVGQALLEPGAKNLRQLVVVEPRGDIVVPVGLLTRADVVHAYLRSRVRSDDTS